MKVQSPNSQPIQSKISTSSDVAAASQAKRSEKSGDPRSVEAKTTDPTSSRPEISAKAREFAKAKEVASSAPDVREQRIADIKARIASGKYEVNSQAIADKLVDEHVSSGIG